MTVKCILNKLQPSYLSLYQGKICCILTKTVWNLMVHFKGVISRSTKIRQRHGEAHGDVGAGVIMKKCTTHEFPGNRHESATQPGFFFSAEREQRFVCLFALQLWPSPSLRGGLTAPRCFSMKEKAKQNRGKEGLFQNHSCRTARCFVLFATSLYQ